ncbi:hypothetical protein Taro_008959 [Colocasia esculenta]|uniref:CCHC-type domain-containing protein n=1 Tax=Colocasia esculenta TaxID=4460 RepID=A0A843U3F9_COLES|nr:hypothetical protein [Colocasia esculenta]
MVGVGGATLNGQQLTWAQFIERFNTKYFSERVQEWKAAEFAALKQRGLTVAEYEAQFSHLSRYAIHLIGTKRMKAKHFLNGLRPQYITQLAPMDIQTYADMIKKAQLLEDAMETTDRIKGKAMKREQVSATGNYQLTIGRKRPSGGSIEQADKKPKELGKQLVVANGERCKHCDKASHQFEQCWRAQGRCLRCGSNDHRISDCPMLKEQAPQDKRLNGQRRQGRLQAIQEPEAAEEGGDTIPTPGITSAWSDAIQLNASMRCDVILALTGQRPRSDEEPVESDGAGQE